MPNGRGKSSKDDEVDRVLSQGVPFLTKPVACSFCGRYIRKKICWWERRTACAECWDVLADGGVPKVKIVRRRKK